MNITSAKYIRDENGDNCIITAVLDGTTWSVPIDPNNRHYQAIQEWVKIDGNTIAEAD